MVKSKFQVFLVPNYRAFRIPVKYVSHCVRSSKTPYRSACAVCTISCIPTSFAAGKIFAPIDSSGYYLQFWSGRLSLRIAESGFPNRAKRDCHRIMIPLRRSESNATGYANFLAPETRRLIQNSNF